MWEIFTKLFGERQIQVERVPTRKAELAFVGLSDTALEHRLRNAIAGHRWVCDACGTTEFIEREVGCWSCSKGSMNYHLVPPLPEIFEAYEELEAIRRRATSWPGGMPDLQNSIRIISEKAAKALRRLLPA